MVSRNPHTGTEGATSADVDAGQPAATNLADQLRTRVVREARRETWFLVNEGDDDLATLPIRTEEGRSIRRVQVNGEVAEFSASVDMVLIRPRRPLRPGAGTIVMVHFR